MKYRMFLEGKAQDGHGRSIFKVLAFTPEEIEETCDFLQWVFPTHVQSPIEPNAWVITAEDIYGIQRSDQARRNHRKAVAMMTLFYATSKAWLTIGDHNHKRITRIIDNISLVHGMEEAREFWKFVMNEHYNHNNPVNPTSLAFWRASAGLRPLPEYVNP